MIKNIRAILFTLFLLGTPVALWLLADSYGGFDSGLEIGDWVTGSLVVLVTLMVYLASWSVKDRVT